MTKIKLLIKFPLNALQIQSINDYILDNEDHLFDSTWINRGIYNGLAESVQEGAFNELIELLQKKRVPFDRHSSSDGEASCSVYVYRFEEDVDDVFYTDSFNGDIVVRIHHLVHDLKSLHGEDDIQSFKEEFKRRYEYKPLKDFVSSYQGTLDPDFIKIINDTTSLFAEYLSGDIYYQYEIEGKRGRIYRTKAIFCEVDGQQTFTFFAGDKQYWQSDFYEFEGGR